MSETEQRLQKATCMLPLFVSQQNGFPFTKLHSRREHACIPRTMSSRVTQQFTRLPPAIAHSSPPLTAMSPISYIWSRVWIIEILIWSFGNSWCIIDSTFSPMAITEDFVNSELPSSQCDAPGASRLQIFGCRFLRAILFISFTIPCFLGEDKEMAFLKMRLERGGER